MESESKFREWVFGLAVELLMSRIGGPRLDSQYLS